MSAATASRAAVVAHARACLGTRFRHQGRLAGVGLDCVGLIVHVIRAIGMTHYDYIHYGRLPYAGTLERHLALAGLIEIDKALAQPGDVLLFRFDAAPQHVAIKTDQGMIHAYLLARRVVEHRIDHQWAARICGAYHFSGIS